MSTQVAHTTDEHSGHEEHAEHHVVAWQLYFAIYLILLGLMALTIQASRMDFGSYGNFVAMAIAVIKATLVVLFFMGVKYSTRLTWLWAGLGFVWFLLMFFITSDVMTRRWELPTGWQPPTHYEPH